MTHNFPASFFVGNRERLRQLFTGTAPIVITANAKLQQAATEAYAFHQDRNFWYLTGIDDPEVILVMDKGKEYLILPERNHTQEVFDGVYDPSSMLEQSGVAEAFSYKEGWKQLATRLKRVRSVATLAAAPKYIDIFGLYANPARAELIETMKGCNAELELLDLRTHLGRMRAVKQEPELFAIQRAIDITLDSLKDATRASKWGSYEYEYQLEAEIAYGFRKRGANGHAFPPIVAGGQNACTLHHVENSSTLNRGELVVMDVGADFAHYAADITRTKCLGDPTDRQQKIFAAVCAVQDYVFGILKPGLLFKDLEASVEAFMGEKLRELGLIRSIDHDSVRQFFPHATSHFLGLDTHDAGDYSSPLKSGMVITVEPGIYVPEESIGVRIEDDVLITEDGIQIMSARLSRDML